MGAGGGGSAGAGANPPPGPTHSNSVFRSGRVSSLSTLPPLTQRWPVTAVVLLFRVQVRRVLEPVSSMEVQMWLTGGHRTGHERRDQGKKGPKPRAPSCLPRGPGARLHRPSHCRPGGEATSLKHSWLRPRCRRGHGAHHGGLGAAPVRRQISWRGREKPVTDRRFQSQHTPEISFSKR